MMARRRCLFACFLLALALAAGAAASWGATRDKESYPALKKEYDTLRKAPVNAANSRRWERLAQRLQNFAESFPRSRYADDALYFAGSAHYDLYGFNRKPASLDAALKQWHALISRYPASPLAEEALYRLGLTIEEAKDDPGEARRFYRELVEKHPRGAWTAKARERLEAIRLADEEKTKKGKALLTQIRHTSSQNYTRITMDLSAEVRFEAKVLKEEPSKSLPPRIYVDLFDTRLGMRGSQPILVEDRLLKQVRVGQFSADVVRVVLDMSSLADYKAFLLPDPYRLVIDVLGHGEKKENVVGARKMEPALPRAGAKPVASGLRKIVLDPGHGGKDPGAIGVGGVMEKDIVLVVAKKLAAKLKRELGIDVVLTRQDDTFIPLEDRTAIANAEDADLFISLHVNSSPNPEARGIETYYLDNTTDEASIRLAARENGTSRKNISDLQFILSDLTQNSKLEDSITLAHRLQSSLVTHMGKKHGEVKDLGVKKALFYVLVGARMPSVLVEMFFITNKAEGRALTRKAYQDALVDALVEGIRKYQDSAQVVRNL